MEEEREETEGSGETEGEDGSGDTEGEDGSDEGSLAGLDFEDSLTIGILLTAMLLTAMTVPLLVPFYPMEAKERGISVSQYGFAFCMFHLVALLCGIPAGQLTYIFPPKYFFIAGIALELTYMSLCSLMPLCDGGLFFLFLTFVSQILSGLGKLLISTTIFSIFPLLFPEHAATLISCAEALYRIGYIMGPVIGGVMYQLLGFSFPFAFLGLFFLLLLPLGCYFLPGYSHDSIKVEMSEAYYLEVLTLPRVWISLTCIALVTGYAGFLCVTFGSAMSFYTFSAATIGVIFALAAACSALSTVSVGVICDKGVNPILCMMAGALLAALGSICLSVKSSYVVIPGQILIGSGMGGMFLPSFANLREVCMNYGFKDDFMSHGVLSSLYFVAMSLGGVLGSALGGISYDTLGFALSNVIVTALHLMFLAGVAILFISDFIDSLESEEEDEQELCTEAVSEKDSDDG